MTEEELAIVNEKRERVRKKDAEDAGAAAGKGGKDKKAPPAKGKAAKEDKPEDLEEKSVTFPAAEEHMNVHIKEFLEHFSSARKIVIEAVQP